MLSALGDAKFTELSGDGGIIELEGNVVNVLGGNWARLDGLFRGWRNFGKAEKSSGVEVDRYTFFLIYTWYMCL